MGNGLVVALIMLKVFYEWRCEPMQQVDTKIEKIETRRDAKENCEAQDKVFNENDFSCVEVAEEELVEGMIN